MSRLLQGGDRPSNDESQEELETRRASVKKILAAGGLVGGSAVPAKWVTPVIDSVILPAHAQTTDTGNGSSDVQLDFGRFAVSLSLDSSGNGGIEVSGTIVDNGQALHDTGDDGFGIMGTLVKPAHAAEMGELIANGKLNLLVTLQVIREFHYKWWDPANPGPFDGPNNERYGSEVVRVDSVVAVPDPGGSWQASFSNITQFNQSTQSFPPEVNYFTYYASFNDTPGGGQQTYIDFPAFPMEISVAFADRPDMVAATGDTMNPYVSPMTFPL
ncbi:MAG: hypothetical protein DWQ08_05805 [Proteobacteria bacterium]|nr:MAG: hypothetical protein DWQ08_05805 [Pseudomonadota bacterium]